MTLGNTPLVAYGIHDDESDYRVHVAFHSGHIYVFPTSSAKEVLIDGHHWRPFEVSQAGTNVITGTGYKVPWNRIPGCQQIAIPRDILAKVAFDNRAATSEKGRKAEQVANEMRIRGLIVFQPQLFEIKDKEAQIRGLDFSEKGTTFQVKCDYWATEWGISLQTHECNPNGMV